MAVYGYDRASTKQQNVDRGINEINEFCKKRGLDLERIFVDKISGKTFKRDHYTVLVDYILRSGDILIIPEMDRLGRNKSRILEELKKLREKKVRVFILDIPTTCVDMSTVENDLAQMMIDMVTNTLIEVYATMAEAELIKKEKRIREGIAAKKARGDWDNYGRQRVMPLEEFKKLYQEQIVSKQMIPAEFMRTYDLKKTTYYRYCREMKEKIDNN